MESICNGSTHSVVQLHLGGSRITKNTMNDGSNEPIPTVAQPHFQPLILCTTPCKFFRKATFKRYRHV